eukprot:5885354-Pleurochrysis_carterae.AAC.2
MVVQRRGGDAPAGRGDSGGARGGGAAHGRERPAADGVDAGGRALWHLGGDGGGGSGKGREAEGDRGHRRLRPGGGGAGGSDAPKAQMRALLRSARELCQQWCAVSVPREANGDADRLSHPDQLNAVRAEATRAGLRVHVARIPE